MFILDVNQFFVHKNMFNVLINEFFVGVSTFFVGNSNCKTTKRTVGLNKKQAGGKNKLTFNNKSNKAGETHLLCFDKSKLHSFNF